MLHGDVVEAVDKLKYEVGGNLLLNGSATLFRTLHDAGLIDEYRFMLYPVVVGTGKPLLAASDPCGR